MDKKLAKADEAAVLQEAGRLIDGSTRRRFLRGGVSLGSLALLTGAAFVGGGNAIEAALKRVSEWNDGAQDLLFSPARLARTFPESAIVRPFPFNAYYEEAKAPEIEAADYELEVTGLVAQKRVLRLEELEAMPRRSQITEHICIEGWSAVGKFEGVPLAALLERMGADKRARYVALRCEDGYLTSIDMASALHPQTLLATRLNGETLPRRNGYPVRLTIPTKLGFKSAKHVVSIAVTNDYPGGFWERQGYNWFAGL